MKNFQLLKVLFIWVDMMLEKVIKKNDGLALQAIVNDLCNRCLSNQIVYENDIGYCLECYQYLQITSHHYLVRKNRDFERVNHKLVIDFELNHYQKKASNHLDNLKQDIFLHAVCGAGKTEITLGVIFKYLNEGKSIAFVVPRVEIIKQLVRRLCVYFPKTKIKAVYAEDNSVDNSQLLIITPQQLIKFYQEFDLMIIDEVDSFPFANNPFLERLVKKSKKPNCVCVFMSATIDKAYLKRIREKKLDYFVISRRHHFLDLPKAKFIQIDGFEDKKILSLINDIIEENQNLIIYLPSISKARLFSEYLINKGYLTECIDSKTLDKNRILKMFSKQELRLLVSTTILERGVTFKNLSVMIIEANHRVFETKTLVQISGRVARKSEVGSVYFLSSQISKAMLEANKIIERMNKIPYDM